MSAEAMATAVRIEGQRRLEEARAAAQGLVGLSDPREQRRALVRIVRLGKATLDEAQGIAGPSLLSHVHMQMAAALFDLAALESHPDRRSRYVTAAARYCELSLRIATASRAPFLALKVFPWAMVVLSGALRSTSGAQTARLQRLMARCAEAIPQLDLQARRDAKRAARAVFRAQLLVTAAEAAKALADRRVLLERARETVRDSRRLAIRSGDFKLAGQIAEAQSAIAARLAG